MLGRDLSPELVDLCVEVRDLLLQLFLRLLAHPGLAVDLLREHLALGDQHVVDQLLDSPVLGGGIDVERVERPALLHRLAFLNRQRLDPARGRCGNRDQPGVRQNGAL